MEPKVDLRVMLTEAQTDRLQQRLSALPFKVEYEEEQHGASLVARIRCTSAQGKTVREILHDIGAAL